MDTLKGTALLWKGITDYEIDNLPDPLYLKDGFNTLSFEVDYESV